MMPEDKGRLERIREYNPPRNERAEWRRLLLKYAGRITGVVELHMNDGEPLRVRTRRVVKDE